MNTGRSAGRKQRATPPSRRRTAIDPAGDPAAVASATAQARPPLPSVFPGRRSRAMLEELRRYVIAEPYPFVLDLKRSEGMWLATVDGQRIFDWSGWYGAKLIGHNHPRLAEQGYLRRLARAANNKTANPDFLTAECLEYYRLVHRLAPACMRNPQLEVYAVNSGAEAVENLLKYFIHLHDQKCLKTSRLPGVRRILYFDQAFHGRTIFALNVTQLSHDPVITKSFHGFIPGNLQVPFPDINTDHSPRRNRARTRHSLDIVEDLLQRYHAEIVGMVVEPLQGAGGQRLALPEFFRGLSELGHRFDVPLGFDEVQTAGGQTGSVFACDLFDLPHPPQAVATAKKFANGLVYMRRPMQDLGVLDSTWGGSLADMVRFTQEWRIVEEERLLERVPAKTECLVAGLRELQRKHPKRIGNVRGLGLYQGFTLKPPIQKGSFVEAALEREHLLLMGAGTDSIRLRPHLNVTQADIRRLLGMLDRLLAGFA